MDENQQILFNEGKLLPVMEEFYSLQGEGHQAGQAAYFIRLGGCDVGCSWCDVKESWNASKFPPVPAEGIVQNAISFPAKAILITGGEPLLYNLNYLCHRLKQENIKTFLETSGSSPMSGKWDWICLSPKKDAPPLDDIFSMADELKVVIEDENDFRWAEGNAPKVKSTCHLYLQPEWSVREKVIPLIVDYIREHPGWRISLQSHKYMKIP